MPDTKKKKPVGVIILTLFAGVILGMAVGGYLVLTHDLPQIKALENYQPSAVTRILSADRVLLRELYVEKRIPAPLKKIPEPLKTAILATEDRNFYKHTGIDFKGVLRALVKDIIAGKFVEGASTLTQQLAKNLFLSPQKTLMRKLREAVLSIQLERRYTKDEILELYLNQVYFGSGAYGVASAAGIFFDKTLSGLTLAECALIAGMPKAPSVYSPLVNPLLAIKRRNLVLKQMHQIEAIGSEQYQAAVQEPLSLARSKDEKPKAPYFLDYLLLDLEKKLGAGRLYKGGLQVVTTLDYELQQIAEKAVETGVNKLENRLAKRGMTVSDCQGALIALEISSGAIRAMVGGKDYSKSVYNRAVSARRQPGSAFKPLLYALAVEQGYSQQDLLLDAPVSFKGASRGKEWRPENYSGTYQGEITFRKALSKSKNIPAVRLVEKLGPKSLAEFAKTLGISSPLHPYLGLALGTSEVTLLELTAAYTVFPGKGRYHEPFGALSVTDGDGRTILKTSTETRSVMSRQGAAMMTDMLQAVIQEGTGRKAKGIPRPVGGKTGTTDSFKDALFIGFSPTLSLGVWVGRDSGRTMGHGETGARAALPIWIEVMKKAVEKPSVEYFDIPDGLVRVWMDLNTGEIGTQPAPGMVPVLVRED